MANPTDHLATVRAALAGLDGVAANRWVHAAADLCNAAPAIAALADECAAARDRIATLEAELAQARAHRCGGIVLSAEDADRIAAMLEEPPAPTPAMVALFDKDKE